MSTTGDAVDYVNDPAPGPPFWTCASFEAAAATSPLLALLQHGFPMTEFDPDGAIRAIPSSYRRHRYGELFYGLVRTLKLRRCVEIGVLHGFSLFAAATALRDNAAGTLRGFDLFDAYPYRHAGKPEIRDRARNLGVTGRILIEQADADEVHGRFDQIDYLHVDVSNDGSRYRRVFEQWAPKVTTVIVLEGGSPERDAVPWMRRYDKPPIAPALQDLQQQYRDWSITVLQPFPSVTLAFNQRRGLS